MNSKETKCWCSGLKSAERSWTYKSPGLSKEQRTSDEWVGCRCEGDVLRSVRSEGKEFSFWFFIIIWPWLLGWHGRGGERGNNSSPVLTSSHCLLSFTLNRLFQGPLPLFFWGSSVPINGALVWHPSSLPVRNRGEGRIFGGAGLRRASDALQKSLSVLEEGSTSRLEHKEAR